MAVVDPLIPWSSCDSWISGNVSDAVNNTLAACSVGAGDGGPIAYGQGIHIGAIFIIMGASALGTYLPIFSHHNPWFKIPPYGIILGKCTGVGILLACSLVHMLSPGIANLTDPTLPALWTTTYTAFAFVFCQIGIFFMHALDFSLALLARKLMLKAIQERVIDKRQANGQSTSNERKQIETEKVAEAAEKLDQQKDIASSTNTANTSTAVSTEQKTLQQAPALPVVCENKDCPELHDVSVTEAGMVILHLPHHHAQPSTGVSADSAIADRDVEHDREAEQPEKSPLNGGEMIEMSSPVALVPTSSMKDIKPNKSVDASQDKEEKTSVTDGSDILNAKKLAGGHGHEHSHGEDEFEGHVHSVLVIEGIQKTMAAYMLEFGVVSHSIFIGLETGIAPQSQMQTLLIALSFHQAFEGLALGSRLAEASLPSIWHEVGLSLTYIFSTPLGLALGLAVNTTLNTGTAEYNYIEGAFNSVCSGFLLYIAFMLIFHDFMSDMKKVCVGKYKHYMQFGMFAAMYAGAGCMSYIGTYL